jgi:hypothetical protein
MTEADNNELKLQPLDIVLRDLENDSERLALEQFARKHGITSDDAVWSIMALQYAVARQHLQIGKAVHASNQKAVKDFEAGVEFAIKKGMESINGHAKNGAAVVESEAIKQANNLKNTADGLIKHVVSELSRIGFEAGANGMQKGATEASREFRELLNKAQSLTAQLAAASAEAKKAATVDLANKFLVAVVGGVTGCFAMLAIAKLAFHWF